MFGYNGTAECCCDEKNTCAVILLDCPSSDRPVDHIKNQFYGRFDTANEEWNETCDKLWYTDSAVISVDTSAIEYIDDNVGVNSFTYDIRKDTDGVIRRFRPGEWVTEINEFSVGSHTIQYIHKEKFCYPWECNLVKYPDSIESLKTRYNSVDKSTLIDSDGNELEHPNIGIHCLNEVIVDGRVVFKAGTWDDIAEGCYNECKSKFLRLYENTSTEGDDEQPVNQNYENIRPNKYTNYLIRRDKWIYVYWGNILATRFYDDCTDEYINLTFSVECGGSVGYTRRIEVTPCSFQWWKPDKWWLLKEYLPYLPMDATEEQVQKRMDELIVSKEEKTGCPYPECCRYISNELKEYSESIVATISGLPNYRYNNPSSSNCNTTANINLSALNRTHKFTYSLCCGYKIQKKNLIPIGTMYDNCIGYGSSCSAYYSNTYPLFGNIDNFSWTVERGIMAQPICLEAKYGEILNISFREYVNYAGVEISIKPPYGTAKINKFGDVEFQMPTLLPFGVNVIRFEYTLYDIYGTTSRSTISIKLLDCPLAFNGEPVHHYTPGSKLYNVYLGHISAYYEEAEEPIYTLSVRKNVHANLVHGNLSINSYGDIYADSISVDKSTGLEISEITVKDQFNNECKFNLIHIVDVQPENQNIITTVPNNTEPTPPKQHDDYDDEYRFKKGERLEDEESKLIKVFPSVPYTLYYSPYGDNTYEHIKLANVVSFSGAKSPLRLSAYLSSFGDNVRVYIEGSYVYADFELTSLGEKTGYIIINGVRINITVYAISYEEQTEDYYNPIPVTVNIVDEDNEAYDFGLINKLSFDLQLKSPWKSESGYWDHRDSATVPFVLYWITQKQIIDLEDIVNAKFVHLPTISRPQYITSYATNCQDNFCWKVSAGGDGTHHRTWAVLDDEGHFIEYRAYVDDDRFYIGRNDFFFGCSVSWESLKLEDVFVKFGVGNDLIDCFNHDEQPFDGNVTFTVKEEHYKIENKYTGERDPSTGSDITITTKTLDGSAVYTILLEPHTHEDYRVDDSDIENNADCDCPRGIQSYWFTEYSLCEDNNNPKYAVLKMTEDCTPFNQAYDNYYNYWTYISFKYINGKAYISDGYREYSDRPATMDFNCNVIPQDKTVWIDLNVADSDYSYPIASRTYVTKYTIVNVSHG